MKKHSFIAVCVLTTILSCSKGSESNNTNNPNTSCSGTKSFSSDVNPIIQNVCAASGCHNSGSTNGPGALTTYQQVFNARTSIHTAISSGTMPKNSTLTAAQKSAILCWIDQGAPNN